MSACVKGEAAIVGARHAVPASRSGPKLWSSDIRAEFSHRLMSALLERAMPGDARTGQSCEGKR